MLAAPRWIRRTVLALSRHGRIRLGPTPGGCAHYLRGRGRWLVKVELWSEECLINGVVEVGWDDLAGSIEGRLEQYVIEAEARRGLEVGDWDAPPPFHDFVWEGWFALRPGHHNYEVVSIQVWKEQPGSPWATAGRGRAVRIYLDPADVIEEIKQRGGWLWEGEGVLPRKGGHRVIYLGIGDDGNDLVVTRSGPHRYVVNTRKKEHRGDKPRRAESWVAPVEPRGRGNKTPKFVVRSPAQGLKVIRHPDIAANFDKALKRAPKNKVAVLVPCAQTKPFPEAPSHKSGYLDALKGKKVDKYVVSEPLGVVPYEWSRSYPNADYDFPPSHLTGAAFDELAKRIRRWFQKVAPKYDRIYLALPGHHSKLVRAALKGVTVTNVTWVGQRQCLDTNACETGEYRATTHAYRAFLKGKVKA